MFRRALVLAFAFLCLFAGTGLSLQQHYCGGDLASVGLALPNSGATDACGDCGMEAGSDDCCKNVLKFVQSEETGRYFHAVTGFTFFDWIGPEGATPLGVPAVHPFTAVVLKATPLTRPPPLDGHPPHYLRNCVFLI
jgi:hypothetical protein